MEVKNVGTLTVPGKTYTRKAYTDRFGHHHPAKTITRRRFTLADHYTPGGGRKTLPPLRTAGEMTAIANEMGYAMVTEIPWHEIPEFVELLVSKYGQKSAQGMIMWQCNIRKGHPSPAKQWFDQALGALRMMIAYDHLPGSSKYL